MTMAANQGPIESSAPNVERRGIGAGAIALLIRYNFVVIFFLVAAIATSLSDNFLTAENVANLFQQAAVVGVVAVGMTFVILTANIDLSVGSMVALSGMVVSLLLSRGVNRSSPLPRRCCSGRFAARCWVRSRPSPGCQASSSRSPAWCRFAV